MRILNSTYFIGFYVLIINMLELIKSVNLLLFVCPTIYPGENLF
jgi:hypothetical protein